MSSKNSQYRGRFAPSPTGPLHFGSIYTAVASFLQARALGGQWLVRIDDLDPVRCKAEYSTRILKTLEQFNLYWDEHVFYQSNRHDAYKAALADLQRLELIYPCCCSRKSLINRHLSNGVYDKYCLKSPPLNSQPNALRLKLPASHIHFTDKVQGKIRQDLEADVGDFIVFRKYQVSAYHLAVAVDDNKQGITEVLRGRDLLDSTPRQIMLQQLLGLNTPEYAHIPVVSNIKGSKLSKQTFANDVSLAPVKKTLICTLTLLNLNPPTHLLDCSTKDILRWGIENWSLNKIEQIDSVIYSQN